MSPVTTDNGVVRAAGVHADSLERVADAIDRVADALVLAVGVLSGAAEEPDSDPGVDIH